MNGSSGSYLPVQTPIGEGPVLGVKRTKFAARRMGTDCQPRVVRYGLIADVHGSEANDRFGSGTDSDDHRWHARPTSRDGQICQKAYIAFLIVRPRIRSQY